MKTDNPCVVNAYADKLWDLFSPELIASITPLDRRNLRAELTEIIAELEKAGV